MTGDVDHEMHLVEGQVAAYIDRRLRGAEQDAVERHLADCDTCRGEVVAITRLVRARRGRRWFLIGGSAAAAALVLFLVLPHRADTALTQLGRVSQAPLYLGIPVRGEETAADSLFSRAMDAYVSDSFAVAADLLARAGASGAPVARVEFFRASSLLMLGRAREAAAGYRRVITLGATPYLAEAHYYLAKALLQEGRSRDALVELRAVPPRPEETALQAQALADSVEERVKR